MTDRERQRQLDLLAIQFVDALEAGDFEAVDRLWAVSATDPELEAVLLESAAELVGSHEREAGTSENSVVAMATNWHRTQTAKTCETQSNRNLSTENRPVSQKQNVSLHGISTTADVPATCRTDRGKKSMALLSGPRMSRFLNACSRVANSFRAHWNWKRALFGTLIVVFVIWFILPGKAPFVKIADAAPNDGWPSSKQLERPAKPSLADQYGPSSPSADALFLSAPGVIKVRAEIAAVNSRSRNTVPDWVACRR